MRPAEWLFNNPGDRLEPKLGPMGRPVIAQKRIKLRQINESVDGS
jgi:hypothetical protein